MQASSLLPLSPAAARDGGGGGGGGGGLDDPLAALPVKWRPFGAGDLFHNDGGDDRSNRLHLGLTQRSDYGLVSSH